MYLPIIFACPHNANKFSQHSNPVSGYILDAYMTTFKWIIYTEYSQLMPVTTLRPLVSVLDDHMTSLLDFYILFIFRILLSSSVSSIIEWLILNDYDASVIFGSITGIEFVRVF